jgi:hypothetical protein
VDIRKYLDKADINPTSTHRSGRVTAQISQQLVTGLLLLWTSVYMLPLALPSQEEG